MDAKEYFLSHGFTELEAERVIRRFETRYKRRGYTMKIILTLLAAIGFSACSCSTQPSNTLEVLDGSWTTKCEADPILDLGRVTVISIADSNVRALTHMYYGKNCDQGSLLDSVESMTMDVSSRDDGGNIKISLNIPGGPIEAVLLDKSMAFLFNHPLVDQKRVENDHLLIFGNNLNWNNHKLYR